MSIHGLGRTRRIPVLLVVSLALAIAPARESHAQVESITVEKGWGYIQTSPTAVALDPATNNYSFNASVDGANIAGIATPTVTGPFDIAALGTSHNNGRLVYSQGDKGWRYGAGGDGAGYATRAELDSKFGSGTYTVTVNGANIALQLAGDAYPNAPTLTLTGGAWRDGVYVVDPGQPVTITTNAFTSYASHPDAAICIGAAGGAFVLPFASVAPFGCNWGLARRLRSESPNGPNTLSYTIPANTLVSGQEYAIGALFIAMVDVRPNSAVPGSTNAAYYSASTRLSLKAETPVFPMQVTGSIGPTTSSITATIQYRPQDIGTTGSVYAFAVAPATMVRPALKNARDTLPPLGYARPRHGRKDTAVACVLAQLNAAGQLVSVSASSMQAYVSGVLGAGGQAVAILNGVATATIAGTTFYVGYGPSAQAMLNSGVNRYVVAVPGSLECRPQPPQTGWWYNPAEGGRGYSIEARGNRLFFAAFHYDASGRATWNFAGGPTSIDGSLFTAEFLAASGGQTLTGPYRTPNLANAGAISLAFSDGARGTMTWPGGTVAIERQAFVPEGLTAPAQSGRPESGWWWNPEESGRGFFIEWQNGFADVAGYLYDASGNPTWVISVVPTANPMRLAGNWWTFAGGQAMGGPYRPATRTSDNAGSLAIDFSSTTRATLTLPDGRRIPLERQAF